MEGIGAEAASLAGHLKLSNLCWIYDNNKITIEGATSLAFTEDVAGPVRRLRLGGAARRRRQRPGRAGRRLRRIPGRSRASHADHRGQHHRLRRRRTRPARTPRTANRWVSRRSAATKRFYGWPQDEHVPGARRGGRAHRRRDASRGGGLRRDWEELFARYAAEYPELRRAAGPHAAAHPAARLGRRHPQLPGRRQGRGRPRRQRRGAQRGRTTSAVADGRLGRPGAVQQVPDDLRRGRRLLGHREGGAQPALRRPRARGRGGRQRTGAVQAARLPGRLPDLLRLPARCAAAVRPDGAAADPPVHPRLHRRRRGRADASADRAPGLDPGHARPDRHAPRRRQRGGRGLAGADADPARAGGADAVPPAAAHPGPAALHLGGRAGAAGPTCWPTHPPASPR